MWGLSRIGKGLGGLVDSIEAPVQLFWDIGRAMGNEGFSDGFWAKSFEATMNRSAQFMGGLAGPEGFGGQLFGAIPEGVRKYPAAVIGDGTSIDKPGFGMEEAFGGGITGLFEGLGREFIREPLTTLQTAGHLTMSDSWDDDIFSGRTWKKAHEISQTRSLGQSIALGLMTKDILDEDEMAKVQASPAYGFVSGGFDLMARIFIDADVVTLKAGTVMKGGKAAIMAQDQATALQRATRLAKARDRAQGITKAVTAEEAAAKAGKGAKILTVVAPKVEDALAKTPPVTLFDEEAFVARVQKSTGKVPAQDLIDRARREAQGNTALFGDEAAVAAKANPNMHAVVASVLKPGSLTKLDEAIEAAGRGDTAPIWKWAGDKNLTLTSAQVADMADDPAKAWEIMATEIAESRGYHGIKVTDAGGTVVDELDFGTWDPSLDKAIAKTVKKYGTAEKPLGQRDYIKATIDAWSHGGWEKVLEQADGNVRKASANMRKARLETINSNNWSKAKDWLASLDDLPLSRRTELIRDRFFHQSTDGDTIAHLFALARDNASRDALFSMSMGKFASIADLAKYDPAMGRHVQHIMFNRYITRNFPSQGLFNDVVEEWSILNDPNRFAPGGKLTTMIESFGEVPTQVMEDIDFFIRGTERVDLQFAQPHQLTRKQWQVRQDQYATPVTPTRAATDNSVAPQRSLDDSPPASASMPADDVAKRDHRSMVEAALARGDDVPDDVLRDYPGLAERYGRVLTDPVSDATLEIQRLMMVADEYQNFMKMTGRGSLRAGTFGRVWQNDNNTLRVFFNMVAHPFLEPQDPMFVPNLKRHLRDAGFSPERQQELLGEMAAVRLVDAERVNLLNRIVDESIEALAAKHNVTLDVANEMKKKVQESLGVATEHARKYAGTSTDLAEDGTKRRREYSWVPIRDGDVIDYMAVPLTPEQLANAHVLPNFREIDKALKRVAGFEKYGYKTMDQFTKLPTAAAEAVNRAWKPAVLLRPAWPIRVVLDEQIRMMSVMGVMGVLGGMKEHGRDLKMNYMRDLFKKVDADKNVLYMSVDETGTLVAPAKHLTASRLAKPVADERKAAKGMGVVGAIAGGALAGPIGAVAGGAAGARFGYRNAQYANGLQALNHSQTTRNVALDGYTFLNAFGQPGDAANVYKDQISAGRQLDHILARDPSEEINKIKFDRNRWTTYNPGDSGYETVWSNAINHQFSNTTFSRKLWDDELSDDDLVHWLTETSEGRKTLRQMPKERRDNPDEWVAEARGFLNSNVLPPTEATMELRQRLATGGKVNFTEVKRALGADWKRVLGDIHGQALMQVTDTRTQIGRMFKGRLDAAMDHLSKTPTDTLSREPFFRFQYEQAINKQVAKIRASTTGDTYRMSAKELRNLEDQARRVALRQTRTLLYDLAEESQFSQIVRFMMPFYSAWQEVLTRYAGIAVENPVFIARAIKAYGGIDEIGESYTDEYGTTVQRFRIPEWAKNLVNVGMFDSAVDDQGYIAFNKQGLNMIAQGTPGFGPIVTLAASKAISGKPEMAESLKFIFPYGPNESVVGSFAPTWAKRVLSMENEDRSYKSTLGRIALDRITEAGLRGEPIDLSDTEKARAFYAEVTRQTDQFYKLRTVAALVSPLAPQWQSPYQDEIDAWRKLSREDPQNAEQRFLTEYGEGFFALSQALSKVYDGVPATIEGEAKRSEYEALIEAYPEFGGVVIGSEGGGKGVQFSRAIYDKQFRESISQGDPQKRREHLALDVLVTAPEVRLGWEKWSRFSDFKTDQMQRNGWSSLNQRGAEGLRAMQEDMIEDIATAHPKWYEDFIDSDGAKWFRKTKALKAIAETTIPGLRDRQDIAGLREWVKIREFVEKKLAERDAQGGSKDLSAKSNLDLRFMWEGEQQKLSEGNLMFADLAARYLVNDPVSPESWLTNA